VTPVRLLYVGDLVGHLSKSRDGILLFLGKLLGRGRRPALATVSRRKVTEPQKRNCKRKGMFSSAPAARPGSRKVSWLLLSFPAYAGDDGTFMLSPR
jgi:hypothetical protein